MQELHGLMPPQHIESEQSIIGAIFLDPKSIEIVLRHVRPGDFYKQAHKNIFTCMVKINERGDAIDVITVSDELQKSQQLEEVGGFAYLATLAQMVPTAANIEYYAKTVSDKSVVRQLIETANEIARDSYSNQDDLDELIGETEKKILAVTQKKQTSAFKRIDTVVHEAYEFINELSKNGGSIPGLSTGFRDLDKITAGFKANELIIVGARPAVGKTAFALNMAQGVAKGKKDSVVAIFSLEMGAEQLVMRMLSAEGNVDAQKLRTGELSSDDWKNFHMAMGTLEKTQIFIDDTPGVRINDIRLKCRRLKHEHGLDMVLIDYLQLIQGSGNGRDRQQEISEISRSLKLLARELEIPVIALSQLSRSVESRTEKRPMLSDLRESGSIEQDADVVAFLYREDYYDSESENENIIEIIIAKQRGGATGTVKLAFVKEYNKFVNIDHHAVAPY